LALTLLPKVFFFRLSGMPPNTKGGKGYKKKKKVSTQASKELVQIVREPGQMPARALRLLGNRQVLCYCNDDVIRNCHICGRMKGKQWVNIGDVVLISLRDWSTNTAQKEVKLGDIVNVYTREHFSSLRKDPEVNNRLLMQLELSNGYTMDSLGQDCSGAVINLPQDDGIEFDSSEEEETETVGAAPAEQKDIEFDEL
jgi:translation initiation factor 1A